MRIARQFQFEAAHFLPHHDGRCRNIHGHSYRLELIFTGSVHLPCPEDPQSGFIIDFGRLRDQIQTELIDPHLDHTLLNDSIPELPYVSAEYLAAWIMGWCIRNLESKPEWQDVQITLVRLWETTNAWAEAERDDAIRMGFVP